MVEILRDDAGGREVALHLTVFADACLLEHENVLHLYLVAVQSEHLADGDDLPRPVPQAALLHDDVYGGRDLFPDGPGGQFCTPHQHQSFQTVQTVTRRVRVDSRQRSVMACIHCLEHVQGLATATLADHDPIGAHPEGVDHQVADGDPAAAFHGRRSGLKCYNVLL